MKLFNVGALELLFVLLLALVVLGPRKAVKTAGDVGQWLKQFLSSSFWQDLQSTSRELQDLPKKMMDEAEIQRTIEELDRSEAAFHKGMEQEVAEQDKNQLEPPH